jgi:hypothetical protein
MVTTEAARVLHLTTGEGRIQDGGVADLVVVRANGDAPPSDLLGARPELVFLKGRLMLISDHAARELRLKDLEDYQPIEIEGRGKWLVKANIRWLTDTTKEILGERIYLSGRRVIT